ncbi:uncharacterized protein NH340_JMT07021 [Sarcoptes scabiei]|nr:uncharacterized protein NH340_JMT07021 [Sarcoptes scabiei]
MMMIIVTMFLQLSLMFGTIFAIDSSQSTQTLAVSRNFRCPEQFGYYADEYNCSKYFVCVFGEALHESCTGGLRFSSELQTCDWPRNVVCLYEDTEYDDTSDDEFNSTPDTRLPKQFGSGMIVETSTKLTTTTSTSTTTTTTTSTSTTTTTTSKPPSLLSHSVPLNIGYPHLPLNYAKAFVVVHKSNQNDSLLLPQSQRNRFIPTNTLTNTNNVNDFQLDSIPNSPNRPLSSPPNSVFHHHHQHQHQHHQANEMFRSMSDQPTPNEQAILQESYDKLVKKPQKSSSLNRSNPLKSNERRTNHQTNKVAVSNAHHNQSPSSLLNPLQSHRNQHDEFDLPQSKKISITHNGNNFLDQNEHELHDGSSDDLRDSNRNNLSTMKQKDQSDLEDNFTLVDLKRSRQHHHLNHPQQTQSQQSQQSNRLNLGTIDKSPELRNDPSLNDNVLGTIGRSINGESPSVQSVSVVASTSSKAILPELDFVLKNQIKNDPNGKPIVVTDEQSQLFNPNNRLLIDEILQLTNSFGNEDNSEGKFDDVITAIVDENGAIHLAGSSSPTLLQILSSAANSKNSLFDKQYYDTSSISSIGLDNNPNHLKHQSPPPSSSSSLAKIDDEAEKKFIQSDRLKYQTSPYLHTVHRNLNTHHTSSSSSSSSASASLPQSDSLMKAKKTNQHVQHHQIAPSQSSKPIDAEVDFLSPGAILVYNKTQVVLVPELKNLDHHQLFNQQHNPKSSYSHANPLDRSQPMPSKQFNQTNVLLEKEPNLIVSSIDEQDDFNVQKNKIRNEFDEMKKSSPNIINHNNHQSSRSNHHNDQLRKQSNPKTTSTDLRNDGFVDDVDETDDDDNDRMGEKDENGFRMMIKIPDSSMGKMRNDFIRITSNNENQTEFDHQTIPRRRFTEGRKNDVISGKNFDQSKNSSQQQQSPQSNPNQRLSNARYLGSHHRSIHMKTINSNDSASNGRSNPINSSQIVSRPPPLFQTPLPFSTATKCNENQCKLPDCFCGGTEIPGGLPVKDVPQLVLISFDDAVNDVNWHIYEELLNSGRSNPNGCPIKATFYVSHEWTDYSQVQTLYSRGHEIASHSITYELDSMFSNFQIVIQIRNFFSLSHSFGESYDKLQWYKDIVGQRDILHLYGGVNKADIRGMRAPFLQVGGNKQFEMLHEENFTYDSSMPVFENSPPFWPYTLDYSINHECMIAPCPTKSFPGLWEIGLVMWQDLQGGRCSMGDACSNPPDAKGVYELIMKNFKRHYNSNRAPFGLYYHSAWFNSEHHRSGFIRVIDDLLTYYKDVYFVTKWELIQWIRNPTPFKELYRFNLFGCSRDPNRPPPCLHPNICNVGSNSGSSRFLKTCQPCPKRYPWLDDNGQ